MNFEKDFTPLVNEKNIEETSGNGQGYWQNVLRRFKSNKLSVIGFFLILFILSASIIGPYMTGKTYETQQLDLRNMPPVITVNLTEAGHRIYVHPDLRLYLVDEKGYVGEKLNPVGGNIQQKKFTYKYEDCLYTLSFGDGTTLLEGEEEKEVTSIKRQWNRNYILGTDTLGRDMLTRLLYGGRISLLVALIVTACTLFIGVLYGGVSGYYGGNTDIILMRIVEVMMAIPSTIYVILLMIYFGQGIVNILIAMALTSWLGMARLVRGQVLSLKEQEYVLAARSAGISSFQIITCHLLPNCIGPIIVSATLSIPGAIATEAFMSFIGLGVAPPMPSWGILSSEGLSAIRSAPYQILLPSIAISITMFGFNFIGDGLRDALDPRQRK